MQLASSDYIITLYTNHPEVFIKTFPVMKGEYFENPFDRVVDYIHEYYEDHSNIPSKRLIKAKCGIEIDDIPKEEFAPDEVVSAIGEIENFVRVRAMQSAITEAAELSADPDNHNAITDLFREVLTISVDRDLGLDLFANPKATIEALANEVQLRSTGYQQIDKMIGGGTGRGEMLLYMAPSGGGKSVMLANEAIEFAKGGQDSVYITFEMKDTLVAKRVFAMMTGIQIKDIEDKADEVEVKMSQLENGFGRITIKKMKIQSSANDIRAFLQEYHLAYGKYPDALFVDYLDLMRPNSGSKGKNLADIDKEISEELRALFDEINAYGFSASQLNREALDIVAAGGNLTQGHIAGGLGKARTAESAIAIFRSEEDVDMGSVRLQALKLRNEQPTTEKITLSWDAATLKITDKFTPKVGQRKQAPKQDEDPKQSEAKNRLNAALGKMKKK